MLQEKVTEWEVYAALGAVDMSEPGMAPDANLHSQDVHGWFRTWQSEYFQELSATGMMLVELKGACETTIEYERQRQEAAANGISEIPSLVEVKTNVRGPPVNPVSMLNALEAQYGVGQIVIKGFTQTAEFDLAGLPTTPHSSADPSSDFTDDSPTGKARQFMVEFATAGALGIAVNNVTFVSASSAHAGTIDFKLSASSGEDVSEALNHSNFTSNFVDSMLAFEAAAATSRRRQLGLAIPADVFASLGPAILGAVASEGVSAVGLIPTAGLAVSGAVFVTELIIEVTVPPGMSAAEASTLLDSSRIVSVLAAAGVDVSAATISSLVRVVLEPTTTAPPAPPPPPTPGGHTVDNTISIGELGALANGNVANEVESSNTDIQFELIIGICVGSLSFIAGSIAAWVVIRRRAHLAEIHLTQIVPTTSSGKVHQKALDAMNTVKQNAGSCQGPYHHQTRDAQEARRNVPLPGTPEPPEPDDEVIHPPASMVVAETVSLQPHAPWGAPNRPQPARTAFRKKRQLR